MNYLEFNRGNDLSQPSDKYIFYDLETACFWKEEAPPDITEYCFVDLNSGKFIQSLVNPKIPICSRARDKTGITNELVKNSPRTVDALNNIVSFCFDPNASVFIIAHNGARFDHKVLKYQMAKYSCNIEWKDIVYIDSVDILKRYKNQMPVSLKNRKIYNNESVYKHIFGTELKHSYTAFFYCLATIRIILHLCNYSVKDLLKNIRVNEQCKGTKRKFLCDSTTNPTPKRVSNYCQCQKTSCLRASCICTIQSRACSSKCKCHCDKCQNPNGHKDRRSSIQSAVSQDTSQTQTE
jgi:DNA polymerase III alpha subunit (gram-positive type)